ncbi:hypothetical protein BDZ45DRAFT_800769 [Acephala macrosclerotiorum]|nr:hypothetical protein BDZ45DRAFT_800769 [Acephala macrosclerotiorum]
MDPAQSPADDSTELMGDEQCAYEPGDKAPVSRFDNYKWRGPHLAHLPFFEYCMLVQIKNVRDAIAADLEFDPKHPKHGIHVQHLAHKKSQVVTVTFNSQLSEFQAEEESIPGGHPVTTAMRNDLAELTMGQRGMLMPRFEVSWSQHFLRITATSQASNIELLRKSKEDSRIDAALHRAMNRSKDTFDGDVDDEVAADLDFDVEEPLDTLNEDFSTETLIAAYHSVAMSWRKESLIAARRIPTLLASTTQAQALQLENLVPLNIFRLNTYATSSLRFFPPATLQCWELQIKGLIKFDETEDVGVEERPAYEMDDFDLDIGDGVLHPILASPESAPNVADRRSQVGDNPTSTSLTLLVNEDVPLNEKQRLIVERVLSGALAWATHAYDDSKRDQKLLYVGGEGGVGKSQIIKAIVAGIDLLCRKEEVILMAPTGAAADNIAGNSYHTALGISIAKTQKITVSSRVRKLWSRKTVMIIDKFSPVRGPALWKELRTGNDEDANGLIIWHQFTDVVILDQAATLTEDDLALLNSKTTTSLFAPELENATTVVKLNILRHHVNRLQMEHFTRTRSQRIYVFPALHNRVRTTGPSRLCAEDLLQQTDKGTRIPFPGLFLYTPEIPAILLTNICTALGQVNGARGIASGIVVDPTASEFFEMDDLYILCTKPLACVLFQRDSSEHAKFDDLDTKIILVFPLERSITIKGHSVRRRQVPMCPEFSLTDYKVQGSTLTTAVLDLKDDPTARGQDGHKKYCSTYVQLSRLRSLDGLHLLQRIEMEDLRFRPDDRLLVEMQRLKALERETIAAWGVSAIA